MSFDLEAYARALAASEHAVAPPAHPEPVEGREPLEGHAGRPRIGGEVRYLEETTSTMDDARTGASSGGSPGTVYVAGSQAAGRGRQGRNWVSAASVGLYATYHLHTAEAATAPLYSLAGAMAVGDAVLEAARVPTILKWPNDVQHLGPDGPRKLSGVLAESRPAHGGVDVFLGTGVNVRAAPMPADLAAIATSIEAAGGGAPPLEVLLAALSRALGRWVATLEASPSELVDAWKARLATIGQRIRLATPSGPVEGDAIDVTPLGELVLRHLDGRVEHYGAGDVTTLRTDTPS